MNKYYKILNNYSGWFYILPSMLVLLCVVIYPVIYSIAISFYNRPFTHKKSAFVGLDNFIFMINEPLFQKAFYFASRNISKSISQRFPKYFKKHLISLPES